MFEAYIDRYAELSGAPTLDDAERFEAHQRSLERDARPRLDIAFVIDTTGSMTDEMAYIEAEFVALAEQNEATHPNAEQRLALVAYGDEGDAYVTDVHEFTSSADDFANTLRNQRGTGGGDYPEAADRGLEEAARLEWRTGDVARIVFWIADAPHHGNDAGRITTAVRALAEADVHEYVVF